MVFLLDKFLDRSFCWRTTIAFWEYVLRTAFRKATILQMVIAQASWETVLRPNCTPQLR